MKPKLRTVALLIVVVPVLYWGVTMAMIELSVWHVATEHSCVVIIPFNHTKFLISMGQRSVPALRRCICRSSISTGDKVNLAWISCRLGDFSQFQVFIDALKSKRNQYMAAVRMQEFPEECQCRLHDILEAGRQPQHYQYSNMLLTSAIWAHLSDDKQAVLSQIIDVDVMNGKRGLTAPETQSIIELFGVKGDER